MTSILSSCNSALSTAHRERIVKNVDIERYAGLWYEIARFPHRFERGLVGVTATYTLQENGRIGVLNQGYEGSMQGRLRQTSAYAKIPDAELPGRLKVYFVWFFGADYHILDLDTANYSYALVGSKSPNYLWILGREPKMEEATYQKLVSKAASLGYDISLLEKVPHE